uniref:Uncharacterized protein n=1 Tax=Octopus bimaculoides TaxID=37653 RepID=A0A0L8HZR2_OCTBM
MSSFSFVCLLHPSCLIAIPSFLPYNILLHTAGITLIAPEKASSLCTVSHCSILLGMVFFFFFSWMQYITYTHEMKENEAVKHFHPLIQTDTILTLRMLFLSPYTLA